MSDPNSPLDTLRQLKEMLDAGALTPTEFEALKQRLVFGESSIAAPQAPARPPLGPPVPDVAAIAAPPAPHPPAKVEPPANAAATPLPTASALPLEPVRGHEPPTAPIAHAPWLRPELAEAGVPPARSSPLGLVIAIGAVLAFLAVVAYLSMNRPPSEHISSTSQTAADSLAAAIETGPQAPPLPPPVATAPEIVRVAPAHPAPPVPVRPSAPVRDSVATTPAAPAPDSVARP